MRKPTSEQMSYSYLLLTETLLDILVTPAHIAWEMNPDMRQLNVCGKTFM